MMTSEADQPLRIMIAMNASYHCKRVLEIAIGFAAQQHAELDAIFVEDVNLLNLAYFPFTKEIDRLSAVEREYDSLGVTQTFQDLAEQVRGLLLELSEQQRMSVSFRVVKGHFLAAAMAAVAERDVLFLGKVTAPQTSRGRSRQLPRSPKKTHAVTEKPVWVIFDGSPASQRALSMGQSLAASEQKPLIAVLAAQSIESAEPLRSQAHQKLGNAQLSRFVVMPLANLENLLDRIRTEGCSLVVVDRDLCYENHETAKLLLEGANCPLVMVA